jgi:hypothetical protein
MYYPKSHITPNLYSNGELSIKGSTTPYIGYYFSTISGKNYTGRFPNDGENQELTKSNESTADDIVGNEIDDYRFYGKDNSTFSYLNQFNPEEVTIYTPTPFYPNPTDKDYELGEFRRYFTKKINENKYTETSGLFQNSLYIGLYVPWMISGDKEKVYNTNKSLVELREKELGITQFGDYLKHNYLKYYK